MNELNELKDILAELVSEMKTARLNKEADDNRRLPIDIVAAAEYAGCSVSQLRSKLKSGLLSYYEDNNKYWFLRDDLDKMRMHTRVASIAEQAEEMYNKANRATTAQELRKKYRV